MDLSHIQLSEAETEKFLALNQRYKDASLAVHTATNQLEDARSQLGRRWRAVPKDELGSLSNWSTSGVGEVAALLEQLAKAHTAIGAAMAEQSDSLAQLNELLGVLKARLPRGEA